MSRSPSTAPRPAPPSKLGGVAARRRLRRVFLDGFRATDVAEPLTSFDWDRPASEVLAFMEAHDFDRIGIRREGLVRAYVERSDLRAGRCGDLARPFGPDDLVSESASLQEVIQSLGTNGRCFVTLLDEVSAIVTLHDLEKPPVRMLLFGMVTLLEMVFTRAVDAAFPAEAWKVHVSAGRLAKAVHLQRERRRRGIEARLLDCLQFSDKGQLALRLPAVDPVRVLHTSRKSAERALGELEAIRNNLAHGQEIIPTSWPRIVAFSARLDLLLDSI
jgi:CBS domain-containing protein